jgi:two-component system sensor histidine kinase KdpD
MRYLDTEPVAGPLFTPPSPIDSSRAPAVSQGASGSLTALLTATSLVAADVNSLPADRLNAVQGMQLKAVLLQSRWENLLCASAIWENRLQLNRRLLEPSAIVDEVVPLIEPLFQQRRQCLQVTTEGEGRLVSADPRRLAQILINLILNASEHGGHGSEIGIQVRPRGSSIRLSILDRGPGVPDERAPDLFALFHPSSTAPYAQGIRLGLPLARALVEGHGGRVWAQNRRGGGARVSFDLPEVSEAGRALPEASL